MCVLFFIRFFCCGQSSSKTEYSNRLARSLYRNSQLSFIAVQLFLFRIFVKCAQIHTHRTLTPSPVASFLFFANAFSMCVLFSFGSQQEEHWFRHRLMQLGKRRAEMFLFLFFYFSHCVFRCLQEHWSYSAYAVRNGDFHSRALATNQRIITRLL